MEADNECMSWGNVGGKLLGVPTGSVNLTTARMIFIRDDWFKATGLPAPKTIEDVVAIAKAMRAQDPSVRFDFQLGTQIGAQDGMSGIVGLANCYGGYPGIWVPDGSGGLAYGSIQPAVKTALQVYADCYADGGIDPGFPSYDGGKLAEQLTGGNVGVAISEVWLPSWPLNSLYDTDQVGWDTYPLLASNTLATDLKVQCDAPNGKVFAVKAGYANPEVLFKLLNYAVEKIDDPATATPDSLLLFHAGPPPENWGYGGMNPLGLWGDPMTNFNTQKRITQALNTGDTSVLNSNPQDLEQYNIVARFLDEQKTGQAQGDADIGNDWGTYKYWYGDNSGYGILNSYVANDQYMIDGLNGYMTPTMLKQWSSLLDLENQYFMQIITGQRPVSDFDAFISAWKAGGGDTITQEVNDYIKSRQ
jgi:putative aldouronate transport system substrate-binding protein